MTSSRPSAFRKYCAAVVAAALVLQPLGAYAAPITTSVLAEIPLQGAEPRQVEHHVHARRLGEHDDEYLPDYVRESYLAVQPYSHCRFTNAGVQVPVRPSARRDLRSGSARSEQRLQWAVLQPRRESGPPARGPTAPTFPARAPMSPARVRGPASMSTASPGTRAPTAAGPRNLETGYPDTAWCNTHGAALTRGGSGDGLWRRLEVPPQRSSLCRLHGIHRPVDRLDRAGDRRGLQLPQRHRMSRPGSIRLAQARPKTASSSTRCDGHRQSVLLHDLQGPVLLEPGGRRLRNVARARTSGTRQRLQVRPLRHRPGQAFDPQAFTRVDIKPTGFLVNGVPAANPTAAPTRRKWPTSPSGTRSIAPASWRMKTAAGIAFSALNEENARVGFHTLWENDVASGDCSSMSRPSIRRTRPPGSPSSIRWRRRGRTPLPDAACRDRRILLELRQFGGLPGATDPLDPVTGKCQRNYHLLSTDGYWNIALSAGSVGNQDRTVPDACRARSRDSRRAARSRARTYEGPTATSNSLADLAMHYWINDIRPDFANNVQDAVAPWQHVTLYGLSIGAQGSIDRRRPRRHHGRRARIGRGRSATAGPTRSTTSGTPRSTAGASISMPPIRRSWPRASSARWPISSAQRHRHRHRARGCTDHGHQEFRLPDELRLPDGRATSGNTRSMPRPARCPSTPTAIRSTSRCGRRRTQLDTQVRGHRMGHEPPHRDDQRFEDRGPVPARQSFRRAADVAQCRLGGRRDRHAACRAGRAQFPARRQVERRPRRRPTSGCARMRWATSSTPVRWSSARPVCPTTTRNPATRNSPPQRAADADGLRRRQRRHDARVHRFGQCADAGKEAWAYVPNVALQE